MGMYVVPSEARGDTGSLELELQATGSGLTWLLGARSAPLGRGVCALQR